MNVVVRSCVLGTNIAVSVSIYISADVMVSMPGLFMNVMKLKTVLAKSLSWSVICLGRGESS